MRAPSSVAKDACTIFTSGLLGAGTDGDVAGAWAVPGYTHKTRSAVREYVVGNGIVVLDPVAVYRGMVTVRITELKIASPGDLRFRGHAFPVIVIPTSRAESGRGRDLTSACGADAVWLRWFRRCSYPRLASVAIHPHRKVPLSASFGVRRRDDTRERVGYRVCVPTKWYALKPQRVGSGRS
jgi:hypothetical protein